VKTKTLKAEGDIFENCFQCKRCSAGCKLTWAAPGTLASYFNKKGHFKIGT